MRHRSGKTEPVDIVFRRLLDGSLLSPVLATVLGCMFGLLVFVILNSQGEALEPAIHWGIAVVVGLVMGSMIHFFLKPGKPVSHEHD